MTREEVKELLPLIQAFAEGKQIQDKIEGVTDWVDTDEINLEYNGQKLKHRIKPEPVYRPFKTQEECWQEMIKHQPFGWVSSKNKEAITFVYHISINYIHVHNEYNTLTGWTFNYKEMFDKYTFADGTPFGIKKD